MRWQPSVAIKQFLTCQRSTCAYHPVKFIQHTTAILRPVGIAAELIAIFGSCTTENNTRFHNDSWQPIWGKQSDQL